MEWPDWVAGFLSFGRFGLEVADVFRTALAALHPISVTAAAVVAAAVCWVGKVASCRPSSRVAEAAAAVPIWITAAIMFAALIGVSSGLQSWRGCW